MEEDLNKNYKDELKNFLEKRLSEFNEELDKKLEEKFNEFLPKKIPELPKALQEDILYMLFKDEIEREEFKEFLARISNNKYKDIFDIKSIEEVDNIIENNKENKKYKRFLELLEDYRAYYLNRENFLKYLEKLNKREKYEDVLYSKELRQFLDKYVSIFHVKSNDEFKEIEDKLKKEAEFLKINSKQNYNISTLLNYYKSYLNRKEKNTYLDILMISYNFVKPDTDYTSENKEQSRTRYSDFYEQFRKKEYNKAIEKLKEYIKKCDEYLENNKKILKFLKEFKNDPSKLPPSINEIQDYIDKRFLRINTFINNIDLILLHINAFDNNIDYIYHSKAEALYDIASCYSNLKEYSKVFENIDNAINELDKMQNKTTSKHLIQSFTGNLIIFFIEYFGEIKNVSNIAEIKNTLNKYKDRIKVYNELKYFYVLKNILNEEKHNKKNNSDDTFNEIYNDFINIITKRIAKINLDYTWTTDEKIIELATIIEHILEIYSFNNEQNLIHYTTRETCEILFNCKDENEKEKPKPKLRLNNTIGLNDPLEGEIFKKMLLEIDKTIEKSKNNDEEINKNIDEILAELYGESKTNTDGRKIIPESSNVCLTSFSKAIDDLPMWIAYSENAKGVGIVLNFDKNNLEEFKTAKIYSKPKNDIPDYLTRLDENHFFVEVNYLNKNELSDELNKPENAELKEYLQKLIKCLKDIYKNKDEHDLNLVKTLLDSVRFIFKDKSYDYEEEVRAINIVPLIEQNFDEKISRFYSNLNIDLDKCTEEIILGCNCEKKAELASYLRYNSPNLQVTESLKVYKL